MSERARWLWFAAALLTSIVGAVVAAVITDVPILAGAAMMTR